MRQFVPRAGGVKEESIMTATIKSDRGPASLRAAEKEVSSFEGEIREFIRRDVAPRRPRGDAPPAGDPAADHVNKLIDQVSGGSMEQIDRVILELQGVREMLRTEGERVTREISGFASLNHAAMTAMRVVAESLAQWKNGAQFNPNARS
jgi:hypothetical protein